MDRDLVLAGLILTTVGTTLFVTAPWRRPIQPQINALDWERLWWRALWRPVVPALLVLSVLLGWAVMEPAQSDEQLPRSALVIGAGFLMLWLRAAWRALRSLDTEPPRVAGTIGLWRPRIVISAALMQKVDRHALEAVKAHEAAHVRHRDPLRIWIAQAMTDLQWPWPAAQHRFARWRYALELARDEEARVSGIDGADLAAAVLVAAHLSTATAVGAPLIDAEHDLKERVARLLAPIPAAQNAVPMTSTFALLPMSIAGWLSGIRFGELVVQTLIKWLP